MEGLIPLHFFNLMTMKRACFLLSVILCICSCTNSHTLTIKGSIPAVFNGEKIYFCPLPSPRPEYSDSTVIDNGSFKFVIPADSAYMAKLQIDNHAPDARYVQILYVGVEPGVLNVDLGLNSKGGGTPANDRLQVLKEYIDSISGDFDIRLLQRSELILAKIADFVVDTPNGIGGFYLGKYGEFFPDSAKAKIDSLGLTKYIPDVSTRKPRK